MVQYKVTEHNCFEALPIVDTIHVIVFVFCLKTQLKRFGCLTYVLGNQSFNLYSDKYEYAWFRLKIHCCMIVH